MHDDNQDIKQKPEVVNDTPEFGREFVAIESGKGNHNCKIERDDTGRDSDTNINTLGRTERTIQEKRYERF